ncbi:hypothetical protein [Nocardioides marmorisolisilvae]|uniref:Uncharacterized protein n=1 Tax=Nocardioides marmorisolisilvae TaxID=1542737 RepID=A0A3N0DTF5_9ACTN|nr:hypothetical protein [Nocardioides marmorisolisilvae]RNL78907.1 hypothetical protein EFL95_07575 [Nocardioides marmorisolisilvae]
MALRIARRAIQESNAVCLGREQEQQVFLLAFLRSSSLLLALEASVLEIRELLPVLAIVFLLDELMGHPARAESHETSSSSSRFIR